MLATSSPRGAPVAVEAAAASTAATLNSRMRRASACSGPVRRRKVNAPSASVASSANAAATLAVCQARRRPSGPATCSRAWPSSTTYR